jgi:Fe/S biogenesis protein NfuA
MIEFTETARERILHFLETQKTQGVTALRLAGTSFEHKLWLVRPGDRQETDQVFDAGGFEVFMDPASAKGFEGVTVDFVEGEMESGFRVVRPNLSWDDPLSQKVQDALDEYVNPGVAGHGGSVGLERVDGDTAYLNLSGGCQGCGSADVTLQHGIERILHERVPEIKNIIDATDHDAGENPYYESADTGKSALVE